MCSPVIQNESFASIIASIAMPINRPSNPFCIQATMPIVTSKNKSLGILSRRPDLSREDFQRYYETSHAPLGMCHYPFAKYVRNHVLGDVDPGFDTISEFWFDRQAAAKGFDPVKAGAIMDQDEMKFMDRSNKRAGSVTEYLLSGPERTVESGPGHKLAILLIRSPATTDEAFLGLAADFGRRVCAENRGAMFRAMLDIVRVPPGGGVASASVPYLAISCAGILWFWVEGGKCPDRVPEPPPGGIGVTGTVSMTSHETSPELLAKAYGSNAGAEHPM